MYSNFKATKILSKILKSKGHGICTLLKKNLGKKQTILFQPMMHTYTYTTVCTLKYYVFRCLFSVPAIKEILTLNISHNN